MFWAIYQTREGTPPNHILQYSETSDTIVQVILSQFSYEVVMRWQFGQSKIFLVMKRPVFPAEICEWISFSTKYWYFSQNGNVNWLSVFSTPCKDSASP
jgi:hypothetical protein